MKQTDKSMEAHADRAQSKLYAYLPDNVGYILILVTKDTVDGEPIVMWNNNLNLPAEAAAVLRMMADDLERNGPIPDRPLDG